LFTCRSCATSADLSATTSARLAKFRGERPILYNYTLYYILQQLNIHFTFYFDSYKKAPWKYDDAAYAEAMSGIVAPLQVVPADSDYQYFIR